MTFEELQESAFTITGREVKRISKDIAKAYLESLKQIDNQLRIVYAQILEGIPKEEYFNFMSKFKRLERLTKHIQAEYIAAAKTAGRLTPQAIELSLSNMFYRQQYAINWPLDSSMVFTPLRPEIVQASVYGQRAAWSKLEAIYGPINDYLPKSGTLLSELLVKRRPEVLASIEQSIRQSFITGQGYRKSARAIRDIFTKDLNSALRIVRTESQRNANIGAYSATQAARAQGVDIKRQVLSTLDDRTRNQSARIDGQIENKDGYFVYPGGILVRTPGNSGVARFDINDREQVVNIVDNQPITMRRARDPVTGKTEIISFKTFPAWAKDNGLKKNIYGKLV